MTNDKAFKKIKEKLGSCCVDKHGGNHHKARIIVNESSIGTIIIPRNNKDVKSYLLKQIRDNMQLESTQQVDAFLRCTLSYNEYVDSLT